MSSGCRSSLRCVDAQEPLKAIFRVPYKWPDSDVAFVKSVVEAQSGGARLPDLTDGCSCRQLYLRSYTFTKEEAVPQKTQRRIRKVKDIAAVLPIFSDARSADGSSVDDGLREETEKNNKEDKNLSTAVRSVLLLCGAKVQVAD